MIEWREYKLSELGMLERGRSRHRPRYAFHLYGGKYPFIQTGDIREAQKYITQYLQTYSDAGLAQSKLWPRGTLCITIAANIAELGILTFASCFPDSVLGFIPDHNIADLEFIYYTLLHFQKELKHIGEGSVQDNINLGTFQNILFPIPQLPEQKAIAAVLSSLDNKIDLLHRQNATLEAMAEALFRQWFVVEVKEEWEESPLGDILLFNYGKALSEHQRKKGCFPVVGSSGVVGHHNEYLVSGPGIVTGRKGTLGQILLINENFYPIDTTFYITSNMDFFPIHYFYFLLKKLNLGDMNSDSAVPGLNRDAAHGLDIAKAPAEVIQEYENIVSHLFSTRFANQLQIHTLEKLRDTLLPKLMSGEVRVDNHPNSEF